MYELSKKKAFFSVSVTESNYLGLGLNEHVNTKGRNIENKLDNLSVPDEPFHNFGASKSGARCS